MRPLAAASSLQLQSPVHTSPVPVLAVPLHGATLGDLERLTSDPRAAVVAASALTPDVVAFANRAPCVVVGTCDSPLAALVFALSAGVAVPIIIASSTDVETHEQLIEAGAADHIGLPLDERGAEVVLEWAKAGNTLLRVYGHYQILLDPVARSASVGHRVVLLSKREYSLLFSLCEGHERPVASTDLIARALGGGKKEVSRHNLEFYVSQVRRKLRSLGESPAIITVRGYGYALAAAVANVEVGSASGGRLDGFQKPSNKDSPSPLPASDQRHFGGGSSEL